MNNDLTLIVMAGGGGETPIEQAVAGACRAAARDTIERAIEADVASRILVVTDRAEWAASLADLPVVIDLESPPAPSPVSRERAREEAAQFHFGKRLAGVIERHGIHRAFYLGGGSAPLMDGHALRAVADTVRHDDGLIVTNNIYSSDWAAFAPAGVAVQHANDLRSDNSLGWILSRQGGLAAHEWPRSAATQFDLDTPTDLLIAGLKRPEGSARPFGSQHTSHLSQRPRNVRKMMRRAAAGDDVKNSIVEGQRVNIGQAKAHVGDAALTRKPFTLCQHLGRQVRAHHVRDVRSQRKRRVTCAGRYVERRPVRLRHGQPDDLGQDLRVGVRGALGVHSSALAKDFACGLFRSFHSTPISDGSGRPL